MPIFVKHNGQWTEARCGQVKHNGQWVEPKEVWVKHGGQWVKACQSNTADYQITVARLPNQDVEFDRYGYASGSGGSLAPNALPTGPLITSLRWHKMGFQGSVWWELTAECQPSSPAALKVDIGGLSVTIGYSNNRYYNSITEAQYNALPKSGTHQITIEVTP